MKIRVTLGVSQRSSYENINPFDDLGIEEESFRNMSTEEQERAITDYVNDMPDQPYWCVESISIDE